MGELQESEETFNLRRLEYDRETWEVERGFQVGGGQINCNPPPPLAKVSGPTGPGVDLDNICLYLSPDFHLITVVIVVVVDLELLCGVLDKSTAQYIYIRRFFFRSLLYLLAFRLMPSTQR